MPVGRFLIRERITSVRSGRAFADRRNAVVLMTAVIVSGFVAWDQSGWERTSVAGAARFGISLFGLLVVAQGCLAMVIVVGQVAAAIASERDRKSLDALLVTRLSAAEIVLGTMAAGLVRSANGLAATLPVVILMVALGSVDWRLVLLAGAGLASTMFTLAALSVVVSAGAPPGRLSPLLIPT